MATPSSPSVPTPERPLNGAEDVENAQTRLRNRGRATFYTQANALLRKNVVYQKRNWATNSCLLSVPIILVLILFAIQQVGNVVFGGSKYQCGKRPGSDEEGLAYSDQTQAARCAVPSPVEWPAFLQAPDRMYRADFSQRNGPTGSCSDSGPCPLTFLYTGGIGGDTSIADRLANNLLVNYGSLPSATLNNTQLALSLLVPGTGTYTWSTDFIESAFVDGTPLYILQPNCTGIPEPVLNFNASTLLTEVSFQCAETQILRLDSDAAINNDLYTGYRKGNPDNKPREISVAYDFTGSTLTNLAVNIWYNKTYTNDTGQAPPAMVRTPRSMNMVAQAFLRLIRPNAQIPLLFVKEMPKPRTKLELDFASLLGPLFYTWIVALLFPTFLGALVYEKQKNLRIMMKMHGLGDTAYWLISYGYFLLVSITYLLLFIIFGSIIGLKFFRLNNYLIQILFYLVFANFQIALSFLASTLFSNVRTATVAAYLYVFGFGLLGQFLYSFFLEDENTSRAFVFVLQLLPGFSLYRGLYEFAEYAFIGNYQGTRGMGWQDLHNSKNGLRAVFGILTVEWALFLLLALYLDQVVDSGSGVKKHPLFFLGYGKTKPGTVTSTKSLSGRSGSRKSVAQVDVEMERPDVAEERALVEKIKDSSLDSYSIVCDNLKKVYKGQDGNPDKYAVRGFSLAVPSGECFGLLGPNGAGKTSSINMMIGFLKPTSGTAYIQGLDIRESVDEIYSHMGVCPQHDLIWEQLSGAEHLAFYGRLKNLKGQELTTAIEDSLKNVNLQNVANKPAGKYSGGMKRRLSVAISLIGDPQVVYMDEPSTGLDPASRYNLWNVIKEAKRNRAIILTTHSMEEAEVLCDRLGIFVGGQLQCIGNAKELTSRYGGVYVLTVTTPAEEEQQVVKLITSLSAKANKVYSLAGTQKFEIPKEDVRIADVFEAMSAAKTKLAIQAWGISDTTLEDVFIKIARDANAGSNLS